MCVYALLPYLVEVCLWGLVRKNRAVQTQVSLILQLIRLETGFDAAARRNVQLVDSTKHFGKIDMLLIVKRRVPKHKNPILQTMTTLA